jgi:peptidoglycan L-alanyl-D-glutamate endopeptidase CwlK
MSLTLAHDDVLFLQRLLRAEDLYRGELDGDWGTQTEAAQTAFEARAHRIAQEEGSFDPRSETSLHSLSLRAQREARRFMQRLAQAGVRARIISGTRTYAEQDRLYRQGRFGNPGPVVTNARAGHSNHNFGLAWDIGIFTADGGYVKDGPEYDRAARAGLAPGLEWGGNWRALADKPHYQVATRVELAALRTMFETGTPGTVYA